MNTIKFMLNTLFTQVIVLCSTELTTANCSRQYITEGRVSCQHQSTADVLKVFHIGSMSDPDDRSLLEWCQCWINCYLKVICN